MKEDCNIYKKQFSLEDQFFRKEGSDNINTHFHTTVEGMMGENVRKRTLHSFTSSSPQDNFQTR